MAIGLTVSEWLQNHAYGDPAIVTVPDPTNAYYLNQGENVIADVTITDQNGNPIPKANVTGVTISIRQDELVILSWSLDSPQIDLEDGHVFLELLIGDTAKLAGLYDFEVQLSVDNTDFFDSGAQTDVKEFKSVLFVSRIPVTPP